MMQIVASMLVMVGLLISRYEFIIGGQMVPLFKGDMGTRVAHPTAPSAGEWALLVLAVGLANTVYAFAALEAGRRGPRLTTHVPGRRHAAPRR